MKLLLYVFCLASCLLATAAEKAGQTGMGQGSIGNGKDLAPVDLRALLEKGRRAGSLPSGMVVRISACLGERDDAADKADFPIELRESWEFTSDRIRRVRSEGETDKRPEARVWEAKDICQDLLAGQALEIQERKGEGPTVGLIGTPYRRGGRLIEVIWKGQTVLHLYETNGPFLSFYRETDARAFGALYERLASQARGRFR